VRPKLKLLNSFLFERKKGSRDALGYLFPLLFVGTGKGLHLFQGVLLLKKKDGRDALVCFPPLLVGE
jgi:hypothetical protein